MHIIFLPLIMSVISMMIKVVMRIQMNINWMIDQNIIVKGDNGIMIRTITMTVIMLMLILITVIIVIMIMDDSFNEILSYI